MSQQLSPGTQFGGYRIIERAGKGGMASVYKAHQADLARYVALKVLPDFLASDGDFRERFQNEAVAVANLRHPNIPAVYNYGHDGETAYIVTEFVDGGTLAEQTGKPLPLRYVVEMLTPIASAIDYAHSRGVLHRDIKPPNILLTRDGRPVLNDFGLARMMESELRITQGQMIMGTPQYMAPEQCLGEDLGPATDIYSLTVVAYEMLTGQVPFSAATPAAVLMAQVSNPLPPPRSINPDIPPEVESVLLKGLAKAPAERYQTASAMVQALAQAAEGTVAGPPARRAKAPGAPSGPARGLPRAALPVAAVLVLLVVAAAGAFYFLGRPKPPPPLAATAIGGAWTVGAPFPQKDAVPRGLPLYHAGLTAAGGDFGAPELFGTDPGAVIVRTADGSLNVALKNSNSRVRLMSTMSPQADYIAELQMAIRPGSRFTVRWITRTADGGDHAMAMRGDAGTMEYGFYPARSGGKAEVENTTPKPELFSGRPFTLVADSQADGSFNVYLNQEQLGNFSAGHGSPTASLGFEAFGTGEFRVLAFSVYQRP